MTFPNHIFLDTTVFDSQQYNYNSREFTAFLKQFPSSTTNLLLPNITKREIHKHIHLRVDKAINAIYKIQKKMPRIYQLDRCPSQSKSKKQLKSELLKIELEAYESFIDAFKNIVLNLENVSLKEIFDWYFDSLPPFGKGKKSKEFPDATVIYSLSEFGRKNFVEIAVVSSDTDMIKACERLPYLYSFKSLSELIEASLEDEKTVLKIQTLTEDQHQWFIDCIIDKFENLSATIIQDSDGVIERLEVSSVEYTDDNIISYEENEVYMIVKGYIEFSCYVSFCDYSTTIWEQAPYDDNGYGFVEANLNITEPFETGITFKSSDYTDLDEIELILIITDLGEAPIQGAARGFPFYKAPGGHSGKTALSGETDMPAVRSALSRNGQICRFVT